MNHVVPLVNCFRKNKIHDQEDEQFLGNINHSKNPYTVIDTHNKN